MPLYRYIGYDSAGRRVKGSLRAGARGEAVLRLRDSGVYPSELTEYVQWKKRNPFRWRPNLLPQFTRQLATLLASGVPLSEALESLAGEYRGYWHGLVASLSERVQEGASLSRAVGDHPDLFPEFYVSMVSASEAGGNMPEVLETLADFLETDLALRNKARTALLYPAFMVGVSAFVLSFVFTFVVPKIVRIFEQSDAALPLVTVLLLKVSRIFQDYWWLIGLLLIPTVYSIRRLHRRQPRHLHGLLLRVPFMRALYYSRFTGTLGFLLKGGIPVLKALELSAKASGNTLLQEKVLRAMDRVSEGASIASSIEGVSPVLRQLISTGERSGRLPELLIRAADSYKEGFVRWAEQAASLLEPVLILFMGLVVGFIVFGILLPIFQLNQLI